jgi:hypothetical protein
MAYYPHSLGELRALITSDFHSVYTSACSSAAWGTSVAKKLRHQSWEHGSEYGAVDDPTIRSRMYGLGAEIATLRKAAPKFKMFLGVGSSDTTPNVEALMLQAVMGGLASPGAKTGAADAESTTTKVKDASTPAAKGTAVLLGTRGDARGNGEVRLISAKDTGDFDLQMATAGAVSAADAIVFSHTAYLDENATQLYVDLLHLGKEAVDQIQMIGGIGGANITQVGTGELPSIEFNLQMADWQIVPAAQRATLEPATANHGGKPPMSKGQGGFFWGDAAATTRSLVKAGDFNINLGVSYVAIPDPNGINGIGGWQRVVGKPTLEFTMFMADDYLGLHDDFTAGTAKQAIIQFGHTAQGCCAITFPKLYLNKEPRRVGFGALTGVRVSCHAEENYTAGCTDLDASAVAVHWF